MSKHFDRQKDGEFHPCPPSSFKQTLQVFRTLSPTHTTHPKVHLFPPTQTLLPFHLKCSRSWWSAVLSKHLNTTCVFHQSYLGYQHISRPHRTDTCIYSNTATYNCRGNLTARSSFYTCVSCLNVCISKHAEPGVSVRCHCVLRVK